MKGSSKFFIGFAGLLTLLTGLLFLLTVVELKPTTLWLQKMIIEWPDIWQYLVIILSSLTILIGAGILLLGIFKQRKAKEISFHQTLGTVTIPIAAIEKELQHRLMSQVDLQTAQVDLKVFAKKRNANLKVFATSLDQDYEALGQQVLTIAVAYLQKSLNVTLKQPKIQVKPVLGEKNVSVV
ncbi:alkaline shock response membrane anchor protein AmaP [Liquorilactobacillus sicerae]|uniref:alkaline shock response membrane anchor protein AmaP n=1 Tax=Liquorilactobacillus sicerae TaxID=1416943 RepID=UPI002481303F|nr:alkaline shock response membrane anchor protein AmaP [Liquorilactobacillus sicerae]